MKNQEKKSCPTCQKKFTSYKNITWIFGDFCSRQCEDTHLITWLNNEYRDTKKIVIKKKNRQINS